MKFMRKVSEATEVPGLEREIWRRLPRYGVGVTVVPALVSGLNRLFPPGGTPLEISKYTFWLDALSIATVITGWTAVLTVGIGCWVVAVMKGPTYEADSYPLNDASKPDPD